MKTNSAGFACDGAFQPERVGKPHSFSRIWKMLSGYGLLEWVPGGRFGFDVIAVNDRFKPRKAKKASENERLWVYRASVPSFACFGLCGIGYERTLCCNHNNGRILYGSDTLRVCINGLKIK